MTRSRIGGIGTGPASFKETRSELWTFQLQCLRRHRQYKPSAYHRQSTFHRLPSATVRIRNYGVRLEQVAPTVERRTAAQRQREIHVSLNADKDGWETFVGK